MQIGRGQFEPVSATHDSDMNVDYFRYKDSIAEDIHRADLVISHAGIAIINSSIPYYCHYNPFKFTYILCFS